MERETVFQGMLVDVQRLPGGEEVCVHRGAVAVLAAWEGQVFLVRQFRYALGRECLELPAGKLDPGEAPEQAARRELREETGMEAGRLVLLGKFCSAADVLAESMYLYYGDQLQFVGQQTDEGEFLDVLRLPVEQMERMVACGRIQDAKTVCAWQLARDRGYLAP